MTTPYYLQLYQGTGIGVRVLLNDLPFYTGKGDEAVTVTAPANHLFVPGENVLVMELFPAPKPSFAPTMVGPVRFSVFTDDEARARIHHAAWPEEWEVVEAARRKARLAELPEGEVDLTPPADPPLPYLHVSRFHVDDHNPRPVYLDAPKTDFGPEGLPEQHEAVRRVLAAFSSGDPDAFLTENALKLEERQRAYPDNGALSVANQRTNVGSHFGKPWRVRPTSMKELRFDRRADGRVCNVTRIADGYTVEAVSDDAEDNYFATDLFLTQTGGVWRVFR
jgi:hypothetical protein